MRWPCVLLFVAACYSPSVSTGAHCDKDSPCPRPLVCSEATATCEHAQIDAAVDPVDADETPDAFVPPIDAPPVQGCVPSGFDICNDGIDQDCSGADAVCAANDLAADAIDVTAGGMQSGDLNLSRDNAPQKACGDKGGRDLFYKVTLTDPQVYYFDTFGSNFDSVVRLYPGSCTAMGALAQCGDDACSTTRSHGAANLAAGTYCLIVDQFSSTATTGSASLVFKRGGRDGVPLTGPTGTVTGTTTGKTDLSVAGCEANSHQPDVAHFFMSCPGTNTISANTCSGTAFDAILSLRTGTATSVDVSCSDDVSGCGNGLQPKIVNATVSGANLQWLIVDGFGTTGNGAYSLSYSIPQ